MHKMWENILPDNPEYLQKGSSRPRKFQAKFLNKEPSKSATLNQVLRILEKASN